MRKLTILIIASSLCLFSYSNGQTVETPFGKAEILGLKNWSLQRLLDTLSEKAPGKSIDKCAVDLVQIGFPDAAITRYFDEDGKFYSVVTVIEPEYAKYVKYKTIPSDTLGEVNDWHSGIEIFKNYSMEFQVGLINYGSNKIFSDNPDFMEGLNKEKIEELWEFITKHHMEQEKEFAIWILNHEGNYLNRVIAAALLINFPESDPVWWNLVDALRDPDARVSNTAGQVLDHFSEKTPRKIWWEPATNTLFYLINGTNLFAFKTVLKVLSFTKTSEKLLEKLFSESKGNLVLSYLSANHEIEKNLAHEFLVNITGKDFGYETRAWEDYLALLFNN